MRIVPLVTANSDRLTVFACPKVSFDVIQSVPPLRTSATRLGSRRSPRYVLVGHSKFASPLPMPPPIFNVPSTTSMRPVVVLSLLLSWRIPGPVLRMLRGSPLRLWLYPLIRRLPSASVYAYHGGASCRRALIATSVTSSAVPLPEISAT